MRILFLSHYFPPEVNAPANRTLEHCREWVRLGHEVHVITCVPSHPRGLPFAGYRRAWYRAEAVDGIQVHRVWTYLAANQGVVKRTLNYLSFVPTATFRALRLGRFDVIIATSPQFFCAVAGWLAARFKRTPWIFELRDLWPESVAAVGAVRSSSLLRLVERLELRLYRSARWVVCVTKSFINNLATRGIDRSKLEFVPNGVELAGWQGADGTAVRASLGLRPGNVLVSYVGTVGMAHGIGTVLDAAEKLQIACPTVRFLIVGDGADLDRVRDTALRRRLDNVILTGLVSHAEIPGYMAATDVSLVLLKRSPLFTTVLPSKMFEAMGAGKPIVLGVEGEAKVVLEESGGGVAIVPGDAQGLADAVARLACDPVARRHLGDRGREYVAREYSRTVWARRYAEILEKAVATR
jgi:glycosyltransferase involved in cell wall biosynthesis